MNSQDYSIFGSVYWSFPSLISVAYMPVMICHVLPRRCQDHNR